VTPELARLSERLAFFELHPCGKELYARVVSHSGEDPAAVLLDVLEQRAADAPVTLHSQPVMVPSLAELRTYLLVLPAGEVREVVQRLLTESLAWSTKDVTHAAAARLVAEDIAVLFGVDACWWTNNGLFDPRPGADIGTNSLTERTFDACLVGVGTGVAVAIVATDED
jgi:hypothetical protein